MSNADLEKLQQLLRKEIQCHQVRRCDFYLPQTWLLLELKTTQSKRSQYPCIFAVCCMHMCGACTVRMQMSLNALTQACTIKTPTCFVSFMPYLCWLLIVYLRVSIYYIGYRVCMFCFLFESSLWAYFMWLISPASAFVMSSIVLCIVTFPPRIPILIHISFCFLPDSCG